MFLQHTSFTDNSAIKRVIMDYASGEVFKIRVYGDNSLVVGAGEIVKFKVNGKIYKVKTDKNGYTTLTIKNKELTVKTHTVTSQYGVTVKNNLFVKQILKAENVEFKKSKKARIYKVTLKTSSGKVIGGKMFTINVKGKTSNAKTNKKELQLLKLNI